MICAWSRTAILGALGCAACIIPDQEIQFEGGPENQTAVRILQRPPLAEQMIAICNKTKPQEADLSFCPPARATLPSGLIRPPAGGSFCICPGANGRDNRALSSFNIYAEDGDFDGDEPEDTVYGVALLDPVVDADPSSISYDRFVAYPNYWTPCSAGVRVPDSDQQKLPDESFDRTVSSQARAETQQWRFRFGDGSGRVDLCNGNIGAASAKLSPGLHNLQFLVTDRPFFVPPVLDENGNQVIENGQPLFHPLQCGVPDLGAGATYAVTNYVFECIDGLETPQACNCGEAGG